MLSYLVYSHSTPSPPCLWGSWKSTRVWSCRPDCDSSCVLLYLCPGSAPQSRPHRSSSCTGGRIRWHLSLRGRNRLFRGSGRRPRTARWMRERCQRDRRGSPQPEAWPRKTERPNRQSYSFSGPTRAKSLVFIPSAEEIFSRLHLLAVAGLWEARKEKKRCGSIKLLTRRRLLSWKSITHLQPVTALCFCMWWFNSVFSVENHEIEAAGNDKYISDNKGFPESWKMVLSKENS